MKKIFVLLFVALLFGNALSVQAKNKKSLEQMDNAAQKAIKRCYFKSGIKKLTVLIDTLSKIRPEGDSLLASKYMQRFDCYWVLKSYGYQDDYSCDLYKVRDWWEKYHYQNDSVYSAILLRLSYLKLYKSDKDSALIYLNKARSVYENLHKKDFAYFEILYGYADIEKAKGNLRAERDTLENWIDKYHEIYHRFSLLGSGPQHEIFQVRPLAWHRLRDCCEAIVKEEMARPHTEADVLAPREFESSDSAHAAVDEVIDCCVYYLTHHVNSPKMDDAALFIDNWLEKSVDIEKLYPLQSLQLKGNPTSKYAFKAFEASLILRQLMIRSYIIRWRNFRDAVKDGISFYMQNRNVTGKNDFLEPLATAYGDADKKKQRKIMRFWWKAVKHMRPKFHFI